MKINQIQTSVNQNTSINKNQQSFKAKLCKDYNFTDLMHQLKDVFPKDGIKNFNTALNKKQKEIDSIKFSNKYSQNEPPANPIIYVGPLYQKGKRQFFDVVSTLPDCDFLLSGPSRVNITANNPEKTANDFVKGMKKATTNINYIIRKLRKTTENQ